MCRKKLHFQQRLFQLLFFLQGIFCNLPQFVTTFLVYIIAIIYFVYSEGISWLVFGKKYFYRLLSFFVLLIPIFIYQGLVLSLILGNFSEIKAISAFKAIGSPLSLIFQLRGGWWEYMGYDGLSYNPWLFFYDNIFVILRSFIIFALSVSYLFFNKSRKPSYLVLFAAFLIFIMLASGSSFRPGIYLWLYDNFPLFYIFREPYSKFIPIVLFLMVILLTISLDSIYEKIKKKHIKRIFISSAIFLVLIGAIPLFSSDFFDRTNLGWKKIFIKLPSYWQEYSLWSDKQTDSFILPFPFLIEGFDLNYKWHAEDLGNSNARIYNMFGNSNFIGDYYSPIAPYNKVLKVFAKKNNYNFGSLIKLFKKYFH